MEKQQIDEEVVTVDFEVHLPADKGETWPEFPQGVGDPTRESVFEVPFGDFAGRPRNSKL